MTTRRKYLPLPVQRWKVWALDRFLSHPGYLTVSMHISYDMNRLLTTRTILAFKTPLVLPEEGGGTTGWTDTSQSIYIRYDINRSLTTETISLFRTLRRLAFDEGAGPTG